VERHGAHVALREVEDEGEQLESRSYPDPEDPRDVGVEGSRVAGGLDPEEVAGPGRDLVGGRAAGLVDEDERPRREAGAHGVVVSRVGHTDVLGSCSRTCATTAAATSAGGRDVESTVRSAGTLSRSMP